MMSKLLSTPKSPIAALLRVADVASHLSVSIRTVRRLIADGSLQFIRVGRAVRVSPEALSTYMTGAAR
jgi:excisionase family DNA binding protein